MSETCTCNTLQTKENTCFRCEKTWTSELAHHEKMSRCKEHYLSIAICGGSVPLCSQCTSDGYYVEPSLGWANPPKLKKRP